MRIQYGRIWFQEGAEPDAHAFGTSTKEPRTTLNTRIIFY